MRRWICEATGKVGVCLQPGGPGATNLVTGIATAYMDSIPIVAITCNVEFPLLGKTVFGRLILQVLRYQLQKHNFIVKDVKNLAIPSVRHLPLRKRSTGSGSD